MYVLSAVANLFRETGGVLEAVDIPYWRKHFAEMLESRIAEGSPELEDAVIERRLSAREQKPSGKKKPLEVDRSKAQPNDDDDMPDLEASPELGDAVVQRRPRVRKKKSVSWKEPLESHHSKAQPNKKGDIPDLEGSPQVGDAVAERRLSPQEQQLRARRARMKVLAALLAEDSPNDEDDTPGLATMEKEKQDQPNKTKLTKLPTSSNNDLPLGLDEERLADLTDNITSCYQQLQRHWHTFFGIEHKCNQDTAQLPALTKRMHKKAKAWKELDREIRDIQTYLQATDTSALEASILDHLNKWDDHSEEGAQVASRVQALVKEQLIHEAGGDQARKVREMDRLKREVEALKEQESALEHRIRVLEGNREVMRESGRGLRGQHSELQGLVREWEER